MPKNEPAKDKPAAANRETAAAGRDKGDPTGKSVDQTTDRPGQDVSPTAPGGKTPTSGRPSTRARTRISAAWAAVAVAVVVLVLLLVFILQNQDPVTVRYFNATAQLPLGILLLFAACGGALLIIVLGIARMLQLHWAARKDRRTAVKNGGTPPKS